MTSMCNEAGEWIIYKTDHFGFNNSVKDYNNADIIILGDSYVEGHCSKPENNIAGQIEKNTNLKVINLGLAGSGPLMILATLEEYAVKFKPKNIVWYHFHNDIVNLQRYEKNNDILKNYLNIEKFEQNLISRQDEIDKVIKEYIYKELDKDIFVKDFSYKTLSRFWYIRKLLKDNNIINTIGLSKKIIQPDINDFNTFEKILIKAKKISLDNQVNLYFIFLPDISGVYPKNFKHFENFEDSRPKVMALAKKYFGNKSLDITDQLVLKFKNKNDLFVGGIQGNHYTDKGYSFVAEVTLKLINNN